MASLFPSTNGATAAHSLAGLFAKNSRAVKQSTSRTPVAQASETNRASNLDDDEDAESSEVSASSDESAENDEEANSNKEMDSSKRTSHTSESDARKVTAAPDEQQSRRKRKRGDDDLEGAYMQRLAREEEKAEEQQQNERRQKRISDASTSTAELQPAEQTSQDGQAIPEAVDDQASDEDMVIPQHESLSNGGTSDIEQASRTVFLGNVANSAITSKTDKKTLMAHLSSFCSDLPRADPPHKIESLRFRSTAYSTPVPKKAAFARHEVMDATAKSTNAYVVYSTKTAAREAARRLNGTVVLDRHLRVDEVAHPAQVDHHRCVFVGNLNFVDDETEMKKAEAEAGKTSGKARNGDVEEGLWRQFGKAGTVESVRVVRDAKTRVSKGIAYVQFTHENGVEAALLFNDKKYPPLLPRKLRVTRAKKFKKSETRTNQQATGRPGSAPRSARSGDSKEQSLNGRVKKLLGRAGGARGGASSREQNFKKPESFVFEGHRASSSQGTPRGMKLGRSGGKKKKGRPTDRSAKRGAAWKTRGENGAKA